MATTRDCGAIIVGFPAIGPLIQARLGDGFRVEELGHAAPFRALAIRVLPMQGSHQ
jgi:hypothetical protein